MFFFSRNNFLNDKQLNTSIIVNILNSSIMRLWLPDWVTKQDISTGYFQETLATKGSEKKKSYNERCVWAYRSQRKMESNIFQKKPRQKASTKLKIVIFINKMFALRPVLVNK